MALVSIKTVDSIDPAGTGFGSLVPYSHPSDIDK